MGMESRKYLIGICDDDEWYRNRISHAVNLICQQTDILYELRTYDSGESVISEENSLDILFLDEELADGKERRLNGKDVRTYLETQRLQTLIICITSYDKYMQNSFGAGVMGFITKGSDDETQSLISTFQRCIERLNPEVKLAYIEARRHQICIVSADGTKEIIACSINTAEVKCKEQKNFVRCQRSYIVNLEYVDKVIGNFDQFIMKDGTAISISRTKERKRAVKRAYALHKERQVSDLFGEK